MVNKHSTSNEALLFCVLAHPSCSHSTCYRSGDKMSSSGVNRSVIKKIGELVKEGITDYHEIKRSLTHYVKHVLPILEGIDPPGEDDRAYYPTSKDIQNHIYMAKRSQQLSHFDQENLQLKLESWNKKDIK